MQKTMMFLAAAAAMSLSALSACSPATDEATTAPTEEAYRRNRRIELKLTER